MNSWIDSEGPVRCDWPQRPIQWPGRAWLQRLLRHAALLLLAAFAALPARASDDAARGELRLRRDERRSNDEGPLAAANALVPGIAPPAAGSTTAELELQGTWRAPAVEAMRASVTGNVLLGADRTDGGTDSGTAAARHATRARLNEGFVSGDFGAWQASAGKKVIAWDVGYAFRPNDVVQQEARRTLLSTTQEGRPLFEVERFGADSSATLVWVNPQRAGDSNHSGATARNGAEPALAARAYFRDGSADWHGFARWGEHTRTSVGGALAWVASDELELHASARIMQRHDAWQLDTLAGIAPVPANPWRQATRGGASQVLLGASWTGRQQQSLLVEWWYDATLLSNRDWDLWRARNAALSAFGGQPGLPPALLNAAAGNLAWQASPFAANNLRRNNLFARMAWQEQRWVLSLDALLAPTDRGGIVTAAVQWQGERLRLNAAWRTYGGPADALVSLLPQRQVGLLAASWPF